MVGWKNILQLDLSRHAQQSAPRAIEPRVFNSLQIPQNRFPIPKGGYLLADVSQLVHGMAVGRHARRDPWDGLKPPATSETLSRPVQGLYGRPRASTTASYGECGASWVYLWTSRNSPGDRSGCQDWFKT